MQAGEQRPYLEDLKAIDVEHTDTVLLLGLLHSAVDGLQWGRGQWVSASVSPSVCALNRIPRLCPLMPTPLLPSPALCPPRPLSPA